MTKQDALNLYQNLNVLGNLSGVKFSYAVAKNANLLKAEVEALETSVKPLPAFEAYDTERVELARSHAKKDDQGNPTIVGNQFIIEDQKAFDKDLEELKSKHKEALEIRQTQLDEYAKLLKEPSEVVLHKITLADVPNQVTVTQMTAIQEFITE